MSTSFKAKSQVVRWKFLANGKSKRRSSSRWIFVGNRKTFYYKLWMIITNSAWINHKFGWAKGIEAWKWSKSFTHTFEGSKCARERESRQFSRSFSRINNIVMQKKRRKTGINMMPSDNNAPYSEETQFFYPSMGNWIQSDFYLVFFLLFPLPPAQIVIKSNGFFKNI